MEVLDGVRVWKSCMEERLEYLDGVDFIRKLYLVMFRKVWVELKNVYSNNKIFR